LRPQARSQERNWMAHFYLAKAYNGMKDYAAAINAAKDCLKYRRNYGGANVEIGRALKGQGKVEAAKAAFTQALRDRGWRDQADYELKMIEFEKQGGN